MPPGRVAGRKRARKGRRPATATEPGPGSRAGRASPLTALHLKFLMPPLQAIDLGLLVSKELFKFVLDGLRQLVQFRALQDLLQHRRHVYRAGGRGASRRRSRSGEERRRPRGPRSLGGRLGHLAPWLARARPPETPAAGPWETESRLSAGTSRATAPAPGLRAQPPEAGHPGNPSSEGPLPLPGFRPPHTHTPRPGHPPQAPRACGKRSVFLNPFPEPDCATPIPLPLFSPPHGSPFPRPPGPGPAAWQLSARWRHRVSVHSRRSLKSKATLPSKLRDAMGRPLWRLLDTEPLEGIGPGRAGRQAPGYRHALNGARKGAGWRPQSPWLRCRGEGRGAVCVIRLRRLAPETLGLEWEVRWGKSVAF